MSLDIICIFYQKKRVKIFRNKKCRNIKKNIHLCDKINKNFIAKEMFFLNRKKEEKKQRNKHIRRFSKNNKTIFPGINK